MKINDFGFNCDKNNKSINKTAPHDNKFIKDIDYQKINHPAEVLGRSMVNFKGNIAQTEDQLREELKTLTEADEVEVHHLEELSKEDLLAKIDYYKYVKTLPDFNAFIHGHILGFVNKFTHDLAIQFVSDGKTDCNYQSALFLSGSDEEKQSQVEGRMRFYNEHKNDEDFTPEFKEKCIRYANNENEEFLEILLKDKRFKDEVRLDDNKARRIVNPSGTKEEKIKILNARKDLYKNTYHPYGIFSTLAETNDYNLSFAKKLLGDKEINFGDYTVMLSIQPYEKLSKEENIEVIKKREEIYEFIKANVPMLKQKETGFIIRHTNSENIDFTKELLKDGILPIKGMSDIIYLDEKLPKEEKEAIIASRKYLYDYAKQTPNYDISNLADVLKSATPSNYLILKEFITSAELPGRKDYETNRILSKITDENTTLARKIIMNTEYSPSEISEILTIDSKEEDKEALFKTREEMYDRIEQCGTWDKEALGASYTRAYLIKNSYPENIDFLKKLMDDKGFNKSKISSISWCYGSKETREELFNAKNELYEKFRHSSKMNVNELAETLSEMNIANLPFVQELLNNYTNLENSSIVPHLAEILDVTNTANVDFAIELLHNHRIPKARFKEILNDEKITSRDDYTKFIEARKEVYGLIKDNRYFKGNDIADIVCTVNAYNIETAREVLSNLDNTKLPINGIRACIMGIITPEEVISLMNSIGRSNTEKLDPSDLSIALKFKDCFRKKNINEISSDGKKTFLKYLIDANTDTFSIKEGLRKEFPLLPKNQEEYCSLLPSIVKSLGIETTPLTDIELEKFNHTLTNISDELAKLSDEEFNNLNISQNYSTEEFVADTIEIVKNLSREERNKVYDYFGYELHHKGKTAKDGFYLTGYPANLNNGKKLADIKDPYTKEVIEELRGKVIQYSKQNRILCPENKVVENFLNEIANTLYELHPMIEKSQHGVHSFDLMKHTLKVMQKISQDENFKTLNDSDKKVMLLASLLHDITKSEGKRDASHNETGAFDSYFIAKKFNLTKDEELKLYTLIKNHEWLRNVNQQDENLREKMLKSTAYDLRHDNMFDMALIFAHADLRAVKDCDAFHDVKEGKGRVAIDGELKSFGECADIYAGKTNDTIEANTIRGYINELKKSQPVLPVTKLPRASEIDKNITKVNEDGTTNIKGVYKDKDGLIIVKYNEVENWEALGFPKGTISKGIKADGKHKDRFWHDEDEPVDTGNIKFFTHGLGREQKNMAKFDAFSLIDSNALLSVSYAERPESKYRFFRSRGLILNVDTKNIHGGGETDSGSGCGKNVEDFKSRYLFGAEREADRLYVSKLVKEALDINDKEYIEFVKQNENKSIGEIEPKEVQEKLVKAYASINSKTRSGNRAYNEMYASNPEPMGVFMYGARENIGNPVNYIENECLREKTENYEGYFGSIEVAPLKEYAIQRDMPMFIFGD